MLRLGQRVFQKQKVRFALTLIFCTFARGIEVWCNGSTTDFGSACPGSNPGTSTFHLTDEFFCPAAVFVQPGFQFLQTGHLLHIPHPLAQAYRQVQTVDAFVEIEDIRLDNIAYIGHTVEFPSQSLHP